MAYRVLGQHRSTQRKIAKTVDDEAALTADINRSLVSQALWLSSHHRDAAPEWLDRECQTG